MNKKEELLALIHGNGYRGMHAAQLSRALDMEDSASFTQLMKLLNDLEAEHILARDAKERYFTSEELGYVTGTLRINPKGFGFVETGEEKEDIFIPAEGVNTALHPVSYTHLSEKYVQIQRF